MPRASAKRSIEILATPEDVYDFALGDLESLSDWMTSVDEVEQADANWPAIGSSYSYRRELQRRTIRGRTTLLETDRPRRVVMREEVLVDEQPIGGEINPDRVGRSVWTFEPTERGTLVTMEAVGIEMSTMTYLLWRVMFAGQVKRNVDMSLASLKRICEQELEDMVEEPTVTLDQEG